MKRMIAVLMLALLLAGCAGVDNTISSFESTQSSKTHSSGAEHQETTVPETTETTATTETVYIPEIYPDVVGLYIPAEDGTKGRKWIDEFTSVRKAKRDIDCFEVFSSRERYITGNSFSSMWQTAWNVYENVENAKIGFHIQFDLDNGEVVSKTVLKPGDAKEFYDYLEIYLYDDIHQTPGVRYSHLEDWQMDEKTIISSIKLTSGSKIHQVGDVVLTAFIYNGPDCFDSSGDYIGTVSATILIKDK